MFAAAKIIFQQRRPILWALTDNNEVDWDAILNRMEHYPEEVRWVSKLDGQQNSFLHRVLIKRMSNMPVRVVEKILEICPKLAKFKNGEFQYGILKLS